MKVIKIIFLFLSIIISKYSIAQNIAITGKVVDDNNYPLPGANIAIKNSSYGCIANNDGYFRFIVDESFTDSTLLVSYIGYKTYESSITKLKNKDNTITLIPDKIMLSELSVKPPDGIEILAKAILNFKNNYWTNPIISQAFYREILFQDNKACRMSESACEYRLAAFKHSYRNKDFLEEFRKSSSFGSLDNTAYLPLAYNPVDPYNQVRIIESRSSYDATNIGIDFCLMGGPLLPFTYDIVGTNYPYDKSNDFVVKSNLKKTYRSLKKSKGRYTRDIVNNITVDQTSYNGRLVYIIKARGATYYIDKATYAIIKYTICSEYYPYKFYIKTTNKNYSDKKDALTNDSSKIEVTFFQNDDTWYYRSIKAQHYSTYFPHKGDQRVISTSRQIVFNSIDTDSVKPFNDDEIFRYRYNSSMHYYATSYNPKFWEEYNILYPTELEDSIRNSLETYLPLQEQYASQFNYEENLQPPVAKIHPDTIKIANYTYYDDYYWMNTSPEDSVLKYIEQENHFADNYYLKYSSQVRGIASEINDATDIVKFDPDKINKDEIADKCSYYFNDTIGIRGAICRKGKRNSVDTILNLNEYYIEHPTSDIGWYSANPNNSIFCFREYPMGFDNNYNYRLLFKDLATGNTIDTVTALTCKWLDNKSFVNLERAKGDYYNSKMYYHNLATNDVRLLYKTGINNSLFYNESQSKEYIFVSITSFIGVDSIFYLKKDQKKPELKLLLVAKNEKNYRVEHFKDTPGFYINSNQDAENWNLFVLDEKDPLNVASKRIIIPEDTVHEIRLVGKTDSLLIVSSLDGLSKDILFYSETSKRFYDFFKFNNEPHTVSLIKQTKNSVLVNYATYLQPTKYFNYNFDNQILENIGADTVSYYDESKYNIEIVNCSTSDDEYIPVVLIYNKKSKPHKNPMLITTYGGGNLSYNPEFRPEYLPLIDRGITLAFAIVRGSAELGTHWKNLALNKNIQQSGDDLGEVAQYLIANKYTTADKLFAYGCSHGGLIMGYMTNNYGNFFKGIIADVPAGDLLYQLKDSTVMEHQFDYSFMGSPYVPNELDNLIKLDPYQNISQQNYPNMLYLAGWLDMNVDPLVTAKQVAKLRANKTDDNLLLFRMLMGSGHGGIGEKYYITQAWIYTFILNLTNDN